MYIIPLEESLQGQASFLKLFNDFENGLSLKLLFFIPLWLEFIIGKMEIQPLWIDFKLSLDSFCLKSENLKRT